MDLEPDVERASQLLADGLTKKPENVLLHWAGSMLSWRNACLIEAVHCLKSALWCCGNDLGDQAVYLRYELGMFHLMAMSWTTAQLHLQFVHDTVLVEKIFFPYKLLLPVQLAAAEFSLGRDREGEELLRCASAHQDSGISAVRIHGQSPKIEADFARVAGIFLRRRVLTRKLLAFEVMYFLRQFPRLPPPGLESLREHLIEVAAPFETKTYRILASGHGDRLATARAHLVTADPTELLKVVEHTSARVFQCIVLFYLGDVEEAMTFVPHLALSCQLLPPWSAYVAAHGLYWCGRMFSQDGRNKEAIQCLREAAAQKKYPFQITTKVNTVLEPLLAKAGNS